MVRIEGVLREFACWLSQKAPEVRRVADLRRAHIEAYKLQLAGRPSARGGTLSTISLAEHLGALRTCFERLTEWDGDDTPSRILVFAGDLPIRDQPLPRFLDDAAFTKLLQAARADDDPFVRLTVDFSPGQGSARANSSTSPPIRWCRSGRPIGCMCRSGSSATTAISRCTRS